MREWLLCYADTAEMSRKNRLQPTTKEWVGPAAGGDQTIARAIRLEQGPAVIFSLD